MRHSRPRSVVSNRADADKDFVKTNEIEHSILFLAARRVLKTTRGAGLFALMIYFGMSPDAFTQPSDVAALQRLMREAGMHQADLSRPEIKRIFTSVNTVLQKMVDPAIDGAEPFQLVLVDSLRMNANILRGEGRGPNFVLVNLGLLDMVENDDQLSHVLAHELEHGVSQMHTYLDGLKEWNGEKKPFEDAYIKALGRAEENEVDIKSLNRMKKAGYNPYAAIDFMKKVVAKYGDQLSDSHTLYLTRINALGSVITGATRGFGQVLDHKIPPVMIAKSVIAKELASPPIIAARTRAIQELLNAPVPVFAQTLREVKLGKIPVDERGKPIDLDTIFRKVESERSQRYRQLAGTASKDEVVKFRVDLHRQLIEQKDRAYAEIIGQEFLPTNARQAIYLTKALEISPIPSVLGKNRFTELAEANANAMNAESKSKELQAKLAAEKDPDMRMQIESEIQSNNIQKQSYVAKREALIKHYRPGSKGELRALLEQVTPMVQKTLETLRAPPEALDLDLKLQDFLRRDLAAAEMIVKQKAKAQFLAWIQNMPLSFANDELKGVIDQRAKFDDGFWKKNGKKMLEAVASNFTKTIGTVPANQRDDAFRAAVGFSEFIGKHSEDAGVENLRPTLTHTGRSLLNAFIGTAKTGRELQLAFPQLPRGIDATSTTQLRVNGYTLEAPAWQMPELVDAKFIDGFIDRSAALVSSDLASAKTSAEVNKVIDEKIHSLLSFRQAQPEMTGKVDRALTSLRESVISDYSRRYFSGVQPAIAKRQAGSLFDAQYAYDLKTIRPLSKAQAESVLADLDALRFRKEVQGTLNYFGLTTLESTVRRPTFESTLTMLESYRSLLGRGSAATPVATTDIQQAKAMISRVADDPKNLDIARNIAQLNGELHYSDKSASRAFLDLEQSAMEETFRGSLLGELNSGKPINSQRYADAIEKWAHTWGITTLRNNLLGHMSSDILKGMATSMDEYLDLSAGYVQGVTRALNRQLSVEKDPETRAKLEQLQKAGLHSATNSNLERWTYQIFGYSPTDTKLKTEIANASPEKLANYLKATKHAVYPSAMRDFIFESAFASADKNPEVMRLLQDPELVRTLRFPENRKKLAKAQLETHLKIEEKSRVAHLSTKPVAEKTAIRSVVQAAKRLIDKQYPNISGEKTGIVEDFEQRILSTRAESAYLKESRLHGENWMQAKDLVALDVPALAAKSQTPVAQFETLQYLVGDRSELPRAIADSNILGEEDHKSVQRYQRQFSASSVESRAFTLQSFLSDSDGIFSDPRLTERIYKRILGDSASNPVLKELFLTYMEGLPPSERNVIVSYIYSRFVDSPGKSASIRLILEAMGPLGIKAGQFLRTSGRLSKDHAAELDEFFKNALPPTRPGVHERMAKAFGQDVAPFTAVRETVGSGSINFGVRADVDEAFAGALDGNTQIVARFQKENIAGQIQNENAHWLRVAEKMQRSASIESRRMGVFINEARTSAMETLKEGGVELDLGYERRMYDVAKQAYERPVNPETGLRSKVLKPREDLQKLIPPDQQHLVSIYDYVESEDFLKLPKEKQIAISKQIMGLELDAIKNGAFDPDGHVGNWLVDLKSGELVRIDYAQMRVVPKKTIGKINSVLKALFIPKPNSGDVATLSRNMYEVLDFPGEAQFTEKRLKELISKIVAEPDFPSNMEPHQRLLLIRNRLEQHLLDSTGKIVVIPFQKDASAVMASMGRMMYFRDIVTETDFAKLLKKHMGLPIERIFLQEQAGRALSPIAARAADRAMQMIDSAKVRIGEAFRCPAAFSKLFKK